MKNIKSLLVTAVSALLILGVGYAGIIWCGELILKTSQEPVLIGEAGTRVNPFYSRLENDIQLSPWNLYPTVGSATVGDETEKLVYNPNVENIFYGLIAMAANVDNQEVIHWYTEQEKTILGSMIGGELDGEPVAIFFYDEVIRLNGKAYRVKISCSEVRIYSFSCIQSRENDIRETKQWDRNKEKLIKGLKENSILIEMMQSSMQEINSLMSVGVDWEVYVAWYKAYQKYMGDMGSSGETVIVEEEKKSKQWTIYGKEDETEQESMEIRVLELEDSILLMLGADSLVAIYYDVIEQQVAGFHFLTY